MTAATVDQWASLALSPMELSARTDARMMGQHEDSLLPKPGSLLPPTAAKPEQGGSAAGGENTAAGAGAPFGDAQKAPYVPPLKIYFLSQANELKERPTPAVRGVRTHWPLFRG